MSDDERESVYLRCASCEHTWIGAYAPMELRAFARLLKRSTCPRCAETKRIYMYEPGRVPSDASSTTDEEVTE